MYSIGKKVKKFKYINSIKGAIFYISHEWGYDIYIYIYIWRKIYRNIYIENAN